MKSTNAAMRKAAILVRSLDPATAERLLAQLPSNEADCISETARELKNIDPAEQQQVLDEFLGGGGPPAAGSDSGVELAGNLTKLDTSQDDYSLYAPAHSAQRPRRSFQLLDAASAVELARLLAKEHPQTIALVLSHLNSSHASAVLLNLDEQLQAEVVRRLLDLDEANPEAVEAVKRNLESRLQVHLQEKRRRATGVATIRQILTAAGPLAEHQICKSIEAVDPMLSRMLSRDNRATDPSPKHVPVDFDDLESLDNASLREVVKATADQYLLLAMAASPAAFAERIFRLIPAARAKRLRTALNRLGALPLSDLERAQLEMARIAGELEANGSITLHRPQLMGSGRP